MVLVWVRAPLLICHVPPMNDQAGPGVLELNVSWNKTEEVATLIVLLTVMLVAMSVAVIHWFPSVASATENVCEPASAVVKV